MPEDVIKQMAACAAKDDEKFIATILRFLDHLSIVGWAQAQPSRVAHGVI